MAKTRYQKQNITDLAYNPQYNMPSIAAYRTGYTTADTTIANL